jgi:hypothetical protein
MLTFTVEFTDYYDRKKHTTTTVPASIAENKKELQRYIGNFLDAQGEDWKNAIWWREENSEHALVAQG